MRYKFAGVSFINSLPFFCGGKPAHFDMQFACPSELNKMAERGECDALMISRWVYPACERDYAVLPRFCIGGDGEIMSIKLFSNLGIERAGEGSIFITPQTGSSSRAFRKICMEKYGYDILALPRKPLGQADSAILIGDDALVFDARAYKYAYDLGELWKSFAPCKMTYAAFVVKRGVYADAAPKLAEYLDHSLALFRENPGPVYRRAAELSGGRLGIDVIKKYYSRIIFKMSEDDFNKSFEYIEKNGAV